jgi:chain length determinant protein tyrosine kinase EpsG
VRGESRLTNRAIGAILVDLGRLKIHQVEQIQRVARERGILFGDAAVQLELLRPDDIESALERQYNYPLLARGGPDGVADDVIAAYSPQSAGVESLRALRSQISLRWLRETKRPVLAVVSPERGEGRSWLAANLATLMAQVGHRTLLMDANMRAPRQHTLFGVNNAVGLSALLTGRAGREIAHRVHRQLRLFVMPAGLAPPNPQELLARPVFEVVLEQCAQQFDVVIVDTPALNDAADAQILAAGAGSALMLARRHHTRHAALRAAMENITQAGVKVIGSVLCEH